MNLFRLWITRRKAERLDQLLNLGEKKERRHQELLWEPHIAKSAFIQRPSVPAAIRRSADGTDGTLLSLVLARWACYTPSPEAPTNSSLHAPPGERKESGHVGASWTLARSEFREGLPRQDISSVGSTQDQVALA